MKKIRLFISAGVFMLAIGAAFATNMADLVQGYIFVPANPPTAAFCDPAKSCTNVPGADCELIDGTKVRNSSVVIGGTHCGDVLQDFQ